VAEAIADMLGTSVLGHDWAMSALRPYPELQSALDVMSFGHRVVGWSILNILGRAQLRQGRSVVLDGVARAPEVAACRVTAEAVGVKMTVVFTECSDVEVHRSRIEGRRREIPNWLRFGPGGHLYCVGKTTSSSLTSSPGHVSEPSHDFQNSTDKRSSR
jgi:predicted kinase